MARIILGTDFSESASAALSVAGVYAAHLKAELHLLHVRGYAAHAGLGHGAFPLFGKYEALVDELSDRQLKELEVRGGVRAVRKALSHPSISGGIIEYAERIDASLIVVGSRGHGPLVRLLLGSIPEQLVRLAPCPVLVVPTRDGAKNATLLPELILAPWDLSLEATSALELAARTARQLGARVLLVHVADRRALPALGLTDPQSVFEVFPAFEALARNRMYAWAREHADDLDIDIEVFEGRPSLILADLAIERRVGLVVLSALGLGAGPNKLLGSTVGNLLRVSPCPVLVVR